MSKETIYREDAIKALRLKYPMMPMFKSLREEWAIKTEGFRKAEEVIMSVPSADRPQEWIPCSERLPKASITAPCLMTIAFPRAQAVEIAYGYRYHEDVWEYATFEGYEYTEKGISEVLAWMPLPKPWKGADDE